MRSNACYSFWLLAILFLPVGLSAQKKFINRLDASFAENSYFAQAQESACNGETTLNPYEIDYDLINCLVIKEMNAYRKKRHLPLLKYNHQLDMLSQNYLNYFNRSAFINESKNKIRLNSPLKKAARKLDYKNGIIASIIYQTELVVPEKRSSVFYYEGQDNDPLNLFYGILPTKKQVEEGYPFDPVKTITYSAFVKHFFKTKILRSYHRALNDKAMRQVGCRSMVIQQSLHKHQLPSANFMIIMGAPRLELVPGPAK